MWPFCETSFPLTSLWYLYAAEWPSLCPDKKPQAGLCWSDRKRRPLLCQRSGCLWEPVSWRCLFVTLLTVCLSLQLYCFYCLSLSVIVVIVCGAGVNHHRSGEPGGARSHTEEFLFSLVHGMSPYTTQDAPWYYWYCCLSGCWYCLLGVVAVCSDVDVDVVVAVLSVVLLLLAADSLMTTSKVSLLKGGRGR